MSSRTATITLGEQEFEVHALRLKEIKKLAKFVISVIKDFQGVTNIDDDEEAMRMFDLLLQKPVEFMMFLAPGISEENIEDAYLDEVIEAVKILWALQGIDKLKELSAPFQNLMALATAETKTVEVIEGETMKDPGTSSTPNSSTTTASVPTTSMDGKSSQDLESSEIE